MTRRDFAAALTALAGVAARASNQIAAVAVTLIATRYLSPAEFGVFALASIALTLIRTFMYSGAFEYLLKAPDAGDCSSECLAVNLLLAIGLSVLIGLAAVAGGHWFGAHAIMFAILAMLPSNLISAIAGWRESLLLRSGRLRLYYGLTTFAELAAMAIAISLLFFGFRVSALIWQVYVRSVAMLVLYLLLGPATLSRRFAWDRFVTVLRWSISRYAAVLVGFGQNYGADLFLGIFLSPAATGLYRASSRIVSAVADIFGQPARTIAMTIFSARAAAGERSDAMWPAFFGLAAAIGWAALAGLAAVAPVLVPAVLGKSWAAAAELVPILCLARAFGLFDGIAATVLVAYDEPRAIFYVQCAAAAAGTALIVVAAPFGVVPATFAVAAGGLAGSALIANLAFRRSPGSAQALAAAMPPVIASLIATTVGAHAGRAAATAAGFGAGQIAVCATAAGILAWLAALLLIRHRILAIILVLRGDSAPAPPLAAAA